MSFRRSAGGAPEMLASLIQPGCGPAESISLALGHRQGGVVVMTSAVRGEGVSTVSRRLAEALAATQHRVLLVDADLREPSQHDFLGAKRDPGLTDVAAGDCPLIDAICRPNSGGPSLLPAGRPTGTPVQDLEMLRVRLVMSRLRAAYKWVILDCPAVTAHPDVATLGGMADGIVLVVEAEKTRRDVVEEVRLTVEASIGRVLGAILNRRRYYIPEVLYRLL